MEAKAWQAFSATLSLERSKFGLNELLGGASGNRPNKLLQLGVKLGGRRDIQLPGMLYAALVPSAQPHAQVKSVDTSAAESYPGVKAVHVVQHVYDVAELRDKSKESGKYPTVRFVGQPVAAVAATSYPAAVEAARRVKVEYELMPFVVDLDEARKPDAPPVYPGVAAQGETAGGGGGGEDVQQHGNVRGPSLGPNDKGKGDPKSALESAHAKAQATYRTQVQTHSALEPHGVVAD